MKLVEFENGTFGVRVRWFFGSYFCDLISPGYTWTYNDKCFKDCQGSRDEAEACLAEACLSPKKRMKYQIVPTKKDIIKKEVLVEKKNTAQNPTGKRMIQL